MAPDPLTKLARRFPGRRVLITGAAGGLGVALTRRFAENGWTVALLDRHAERLRAASTELGPRAHPYPVDVTDPGAVRRSVNRFVKEAGTPDIVVNNAGIGAGASFFNTTMEDFVQLMAVNFLGSVIVCRTLLPPMVERGTGALANIASAAAFVSAPSMSAYNASKAALVSLSETLAAELRPHGISVSAVMPGFFPSRIVDDMRGTGQARERARALMASSRYSTDAAANDVIRGLARGAAYIVAPRSIRVLWYYKRLLPGVFARHLGRLRRGTSTTRS